MQLRQLIGRLQSPNFQAVAEISHAIGAGMRLSRQKTVRFPGEGSCQLWEFKHPVADDQTVVVAVCFRKKAIASWKRLDQPFDEALAHYEHQRQHQQQRRQPSAVNTLHSPALPAGIKMVLPGVDTGAVGVKP